MRVELVDAPSSIIFAESIWEAPARTTSTTEEETESIMPAPAMIQYTLTVPGTPALILEVKSGWTTMTAGPPAVRTASRPTSTSVPLYAISVVAEM